MAVYMKVRETANNLLDDERKDDLYEATANALVWDGMIIAGRAAYQLLTGVRFTSPYITPAMFIAQVGLGYAVNRLGRKLED